MQFINKILYIILYIVVMLYYSDYIIITLIIRIYGKWAIKTSPLLYRYLLITKLCTE